MTRKKKQLFTKMKIRDCFVGLERNAHAESLTWLDMTANVQASVTSNARSELTLQQGAALRHNRRASVVFCR